MTTPVHLVAGWLGTGKTTALLDRLERWRGQRVAVLVNDFGEAAVDRTLLDDADTPRLMTEIRGACVCCTAPEGFTDAVGLLLDEVGPDRILIEPTGLAHPADLVDTLLRGPHRERIDLQPVVVLVDPAHLDPEDPDLRAQVEAADVLVANRTDLASPPEMARFRDFAGRLWPRPLAVHETTHGRLPDSAFSWPDGAGPRAPERRAHGHETHGMHARSVVWSPEVRFRRDLPLVEGLARLKGLFRTPEGTFLVEVAGGHRHERPSPWRRDSRVDLLARDPALLDAAVEALEQARLSEDELVLDPHRIEVVRPDGTRLDVDRRALRQLEAIDVAPLIPRREGTAAPLWALLERVGFTSGVQAVVVAADGYATPPVPVEALEAGLLLHTLHDQPLGPEQGGPFRLLIPGDAGPGGPCANVKGVVRIALRLP